MNIYSLNKALKLLINPVNKTRQIQTPQLDCKVTLIQFTQCCLLLFLLISLNANSAFLIDDYTGDRNGYCLIRDGVRVQVGAMMPLKPGDELSVVSDTGKLTLKEYDGDREETHVITKEDKSYTIPNSKLPVIIRNLLAINEKWIKNTFYPEETILKELKSRSSSAKILLYGERFDESKLDNNLIVGFDSLSVYWLGMQPPFTITLKDENGHIIAEETNVVQNNITLTKLALAIGNYDLRVENEFSSSLIKLAVVDLSKVPLSYIKISQSQIPEKIKNYYATLAMASDPMWLFQALQMADRYGLQTIKENILNGYAPAQIDVQ